MAVVGRQGAAGSFYCINALAWPHNWVLSLAMTICAVRLILIFQWAGRSILIGDAADCALSWHLAREHGIDGVKCVCQAGGGILFRQHVICELHAKSPCRLAVAPLLMQHGLRRAGAAYVHVICA